MSRKRKWLVLMLLAVWIQAPAQLSLPKIIGNGMVLQRNMPVPVWGTAAAGMEVWVQFHGQEKKSMAGNDGNWKIILDAMPAAADPAKMVIKTMAESIVLTNILVGEVWLCSGQSNMEYSMRKNSKVTVPPGTTGWPVNELETAHNKSIRIFFADRKKMKPDPAHAGWDVAEDSALRSFSAAGYFFAKKIVEELRVPVGMIEAAIPGSRIEPWMPAEAFNALPFFREQTDSTHKIDGEPGKFYSTMIAPLAPFSIKGFLWYQGESNCFLNERLQYAYKMEALIKQWRKIWGSDSLPFYYVQIAPFAYSKSTGKVSYTTESLPEFWEVQALALKIPHTAMAATADLNTDLDNLHPHYKWEIGRRLALCALAGAYGRTDILSSGPVYRKMTITGNTIQIDFDHAGSGLVNMNAGELAGFTIAAADGKFVPAKAVIKRNTVEVAAAGIIHPVAVRFDWNEGGNTGLFNKNGLPALSFRTDNPVEKKFSLTVQ